MNEDNIASALDTFRADAEAVARGQSKVFLNAGRFATVTRTNGFDYVRLYDIRGAPVTAKRFRI